jgi:hypothetical protein
MTGGIWGYRQKAAPTQTTHQTENLINGYIDDCNLFVASFEQLDEVAFSRMSKAQIRAANFLPAQTAGFLCLTPATFSPQTLSVIERG